MFILDSQNSIANQFLLELRDKEIQQDRFRFRKNMERLGEIMAVEVSRKLNYAPYTIETPLGKKKISVVQEQPVLITILRAGIPFYQGFANYFDSADSGFIGAYRQEDEKHLTIKLEYLATPSVTGRTVILIDPMLATGRSVIDSVAAILKNGKPSHVHIVSLVAAPEGIEYLKKSMTIPFSIWACSVDDELNQQFYIVPGLGDAGDLSFGPKL